jgi:phosphoribosylformylglycinamidine cyclo-ligase
VPPVPALFLFVMERGGIGADEAYATFNMGAGYAVYVAEDDASRVAALARARGLVAWRAGHVEAGPRELVIEPLRTRYGGDALVVRG